ncbi:MAG: TetR/AcrR family transcriptional regulator [Actinomycetota bacterium]
MSALERRGQLIEAGLRVIAREGMHGATVRAIVAEAGVPLATFHYVFASREEMIGEAYAYVAVQPEDDLARLVPAGATPEDAVRAMLTHWFERFLQHPEYELAIMEIMAFCSRTPALAHLPAQVQERYVEVVESVLQVLRARFEVVGGPSSREVASLLVHVTDGITYAWLRTRDTAASHRMIDLAVPPLAAAMTGRG